MPASSGGLARNPTLSRSRGGRKGCYERSAEDSHSGAAFREHPTSEASFRERLFEKLSEKWFEQSFDRELAGIRTSDGAKTRSLGGPKDLAISALGTFQTVLSTFSRTVHILALGDL